LTIVSENSGLQFLSFGSQNQIGFVGPTWKLVRQISEDLIVTMVGARNS